MAFLGSGFSVSFFIVMHGLGWAMGTWGISSARFGRLSTGQDRARGGEFYVHAAGECTYLRFVLLGRERELS